MNLDQTTQPTEDEKDLAGALIAAGRCVMAAGMQTTEFYTALVPTDSDPVIRIQVCTESGVFVVAITQEVARRLGVDLQQMGSRKKLSVVGGK